MARTARGLAGIQYCGIPGASKDCKDAVLRLLQFGDHISHARILTHDNAHCLLLTVDGTDLVGIKSGFASGYGGEGPSAFSYVLALLYAHSVDIEEYQVSEELIERLDRSALTVSDSKMLNAAKPVRPNRWADYISEDDWEKGENRMLWSRFKPVIPFAIIDSRIVDLALKFDEQPDDCLLTGYRRLEDNVRDRTEVEEHGAKLFSQVFLSDPPKLTWGEIDRAEHAGRASLFTGTFMAYRNPRAHREPHKYSSELGEFLLLNHLFLLERDAVDQSGNPRQPEDPIETLLKEASSAKWKRRRK